MANRKKANIFFIKFLIFTAMLLAVFIIIARAGYIISASSIFINHVSTSVPQPQSEKQIVVIDAGHGGADNGASSASGIREKDINLSVSKMLGDLLCIMGFDVRYTRTQDISPGNDEGFVKRNDLSYRVKFTRELENPIFVSIHMNKFGIEKYSGAQTFYSKNDPTSEALAIRIQKVIRSLIQPDNNREIKKASSAIFVLDRLECPAVLVECGFLSNEKEAQLLTEKHYQKKLAFCIAMGICDYFKNE